MHNEELCRVWVYCSKNISQGIKWRMRWAVHVARTGRLWSGSLKRRGRLEDVDVRVILKLILRWRSHHITHVSTKLSPTHRPHSPSPHITTHYLYVLYGLQNRHFPWESTDSPGHIARKLTFQPTTPPDFRNSAPPAAPRDLCSSLDNIRLPDIIYVCILSRCLRSRHHNFLFFVFVFCFLFFVFLFFWFVVAYCTQLLSKAMYNLMMATTMAETCSC